MGQTALACWHCVAVSRNSCSLRCAQSRSSSRFSEPISSQSMFSADNASKSSLVITLWLRVLRADRVSASDGSVASELPLCWALHFSSHFFLALQSSNDKCALTNTTTSVQWPLFQDTLGKLVPERYNQSGINWGKRWWGLGMLWHQLDRMQTICTLLQTDNHTNTSLHNFYGPDTVPDTQPKVLKNWSVHYTHTPVQRPFFQDYPGEPEPER